MSENKKYGLILPDRGKAPKPTFKASHNVFGDDSESEDESNKRPVLLRPSDNINRQAKITQEKAIMEDSTVYQYDEIYDTLASKKESKKDKSKEEKKPKYIENLIKTANKRKIEHERRVERQIQKEREKEGDEFADKEIFVTSAYKKKLEELKKEEEREKYEEYLESIGDVTRQKDLGGFYRHLYEQKLGSDDANKTDDKKEQSEGTSEKGSKKDISDNLKSSKNRNYRKRKISHDSNKKLSDGEIEDSDEEINRCNLEDIRIAKKSKALDPNIDADSDFSIDESSDEEDKDIKKPDVQKTDVKSPTSKTEKDTIPDIEPVTENVVIETKVKIDIWKKRTVGEVFDQALKRYYERKAARGS
ncbi:nuclear speckle splicing regulatory protein 1 [Epargyreus clarus]|uniref:nuclear speckle splicing regulatory protein 1 n=1 Tax=Epargyreus clarus TaxID=520877 RepID=UPI003C30522A